MLRDAIVAVLMPQERATRIVAVLERSFYAFPGSIELQARLNR
jgi:hypothetical protein